MNKALFFCIVLLLIVCPAAAETEAYIFRSAKVSCADSLQNQAQEYFDLALASYRQKDMETARGYISRAIALDPEAVSFRKLALDISRERGDVPGMSESLATLIRLDPGERQHYMDRAYVLAYMGKFEEALAVHQQLGEQFGPDEESLLARAGIHQAMDNPSAAIADLESLMQQDPPPRETITYITLAEYYTQAGRSGDALQILDRANALFPDNPLVPLAKADAYQEKGDLDQAFRHIESGFSNARLDIDAKAGILYNMLDQAVYPPAQLLQLAGVFIDAYPQDARAYAVNGDIQARFEKYGQARQSYVRALELNRRMPAVWQQLLQLLLFSGDLEEARRLGTAASALFPREADILLMTGNAFLGGKDYPTARKYLEAALNNEDQENSEALTWIYGTLGGVYHALEMHAESDVAFSEALVHDSLNVFVLNNYAYYLAVRKENLGEAAAMSGRATALRPGEATYEDTHAWVLFQMGRYEEALVWIRNAIGNADSPSPTLLEHYGDILYRNGRPRDAVNQWKKAIKQADANYENLDKLSRKIDERRIVD